MTDDTSADKLNGNTFCIYCFSRDKSSLTKSHLFPQSIGGRVYDYFACRRCNCLIGSKIEGEVSSCLFFSVGRDRLGICPKDQAYSGIDITDANTGQPLKLDGDVLKARLSFDPETESIAGSNKDVRRKIREILKKRFPNWLDHVDKQLDNQEGGRFSLPGGKIYSFQSESLADRAINLSGKSRFPLDLLAKLTFELLWLFRPFSPTSAGEFYQSTFLPYGKIGHFDNLVINPLFSKRFSIYEGGVLTGHKQYDQVDYAPFHQINFGISSQGTAYIRINFFEAASFVIAVEKTTVEDCLNPESFDNRHIFPIDKNEYQLVDKADYSKGFRAEEAAAADRCFAAFESARDGDGEQAHP